MQCPAKEPDIALYMRVCNPCQEKISNKQIIDNNATEDAVQEGGDNLVRLEALHNNSVKLEQKTESQLAQVKNQLIFHYHSLSLTLITDT